MSTRDDEEMEWEECRRHQEEDEERRQERREEEDDHLRQSAEDYERQMQDEAEYQGQPQESPGKSLPVGGGGCASVMTISVLVVLVAHVLR